MPLCGSMPHRCDGDIFFDLSKTDKQRVAEYSTENLFVFNKSSGISQYKYFSFYADEAFTAWLHFGLYIFTRKIANSKINADSSDVLYKLLSDFDEIVPNFVCRCGWVRRGSTIESLLIFLETMYVSSFDMRNAKTRKLGF